MPQVNPYLGQSEQRLTLALNQTSNKNLIYGVDFTFGQIIVQPGEGGRNTRIEVVPLHGESRSWHSYTRLPLNVLSELTGTATPMGVFIPHFPFTAHSALQQINEALGLSLTAAEVVNTSYTEVQSSYRLVINQSVAWLPQSFFDFQALFD